jgi:hypothetical protein
MYITRVSALRSSTSISRPWSFFSSPPFFSSSLGYYPRRHNALYRKRRVHVATCTRTGARANRSTGRVRSSHRRRSNFRCFPTGRVEPAEFLSIARRVSSAAHVHAETIRACARTTKYICIYIYIHRMCVYFRVRVRVSVWNLESSSDGSVLVAFYVITKHV